MDWVSPIFRATPPDFQIADVSVCLALLHERRHWNELMDLHHHLGFGRLSSCGIRYVIQCRRRWIGLADWKSGTSWRDKRRRVDFPYRRGSSPDHVGKVAHLAPSDRLPQPHGLSAHSPITHARASHRPLLRDSPHAARLPGRFPVLHGSKPPDATIFTERDPSGSPCSRQESGRRQQARRPVGTHRPLSQVSSPTQTIRRTPIGDMALNQEPPGHRITPRQLKPRHRETRTPRQGMNRTRRPTAATISPATR